MNRLVLVLALLQAKPYPVPLPGTLVASSKFSDLYKITDPETGATCFMLFHADEVSQIAISCLKVKP
jgi:hypothetical protein